VRHAAAGPEGDRRPGREPPAGTRGAAPGAGGRTQTAGKRTAAGANSPPGLDRPAFYALAPGGWRDLVTVLHPPYTAWHLSYVALGAAAAPRLYLGRLGASVAAFALAVGVAAHALDELHGRPLQTRLPDGALVALAAVGLGGAVAIGAVGAATISPWLVPLIAAGAALVLAYNLELLGGRLHSDAWFALAWGGFPAFTGYFACSLEVRPAGLLVAGGCVLLSVAQRRLSAPVRELRRRTAGLRGVQELQSGELRELDAAAVAAPMEGALRAMWLAVVLLAAGLVAVRV